MSTLTIFKTAPREPKSESPVTAWTGQLVKLKVETHQAPLREKNNIQAARPEKLVEKLSIQLSHSLFLQGFWIVSVGHLTVQGPNWMQQRSRALDALWHSILQARLMNWQEHRKRIGRHKQVQSKLNLNGLGCAPDRQLVLQAPSAQACQHRWHPIVHVAASWEIDGSWPWTKAREIPKATLRFCPTNKNLRILRHCFAWNKGPDNRQLKPKAPKAPWNYKGFQLRRDFASYSGLAFASKKAYLQLFFRPKYAASNSFTSSGAAIASSVLQERWPWISECPYQTLTTLPFQSSWNLGPKECNYEDILDSSRNMNFAQKACAGNIEVVFAKSCPKRSITRENQQQERSFLGNAHPLRL